MNSVNAPTRNKNRITRQTGGTPSHGEQVTVRPGQEKLEKFMKKHTLQRLIYNSKGGIFENYMCTTKTNISSPASKHQPLAT